MYVVLFLFFLCFCEHRCLRSFPTRRSSDLIKLLEEILSFRMQGVEFDNGDMYVDGHKAASDVRDEFVSVTEKQRYGRQHTYHHRSEERFSRNAETDLVCRLLLEKKKKQTVH